MEIDKTQLITLLKEKYDYEVQRKLHFESILNIPITMLGLLSAGIFYVLNIPIANNYVWFNTSKPCLIGINILSVTVAVFFIFRFYFGLKREYMSFPNSDEVAKCFNELVEHYNRYIPNTEKSFFNIFIANEREKKINENVKKKFQDNIIGWYIDINTNNSGINDKRAIYLFNAKLLIGISYFVLLLTYILFLTNKF